MQECEKIKKSEPSMSLWFDELALYLREKDPMCIHGKSNQSFYKTNMSRGSSISYININNFKIYNNNTSNYMNTVLSEKETGQMSPKDQLEVQRVLQEGLQNNTQETFENIDENQGRNLI